MKTIHRLNADAPSEEPALDAAERRIQQRRVFNRQQALGMLVLAAGVLVYRLLHTPAGWIFPAGWWRLW